MGQGRGGWMPIVFLHLFSLCVFLLQISSGEYVEQFLESVEVCTSAAVGPFSNLAKKRIRLQNYPNNTVMVKLTRWDQFWPSFMNFRCKFQVSAPKKHGVMVVIQSMHLRTKKPQSAECRDWIKFEQNDGFKAGPICGELDDNDFSKVPDNVIGPRYFYDNSGLTDVSFSTDDNDPEDKRKPIYLKMIFTAYQECSEMAVSQGKLRRCSSLRSHSCIAANLFCDKEINCGFNDSDFGLDEKNCDGEGNAEWGKNSSRTSSYYMFTTTCIVTLLVVSLIIVFAACWCLQKYKERDNSLQMVYIDPDAQMRMPHGINMAESSLPAMGSTEVPEKRPEDRPPSYDDLFPVSETKKHHPSPSHKSIDGN